MDLIGQYKQHTFPASRIASVDICELSRRRHTIQALIEVDVTKPRQMLRELKKKREKVSFTAFVIKCIGCVCEEYKSIHAYKKGKTKIVMFDDVDVSLIVERVVQGESVPLPLVIRKTNEKSVSQIFLEIRKAQQQSIESESDYVLGGGLKSSVMKLYYALPGFARRLALKSMMQNPLRAKKYMGSVAVTALGMMGQMDGWFVPMSVHPLCVAVGSIVKKPCVTGDGVGIREYVYLTVLADHDVVDGAPAARALARLTELMTQGYGLEQAVEET